MAQLLRSGHLLFAPLTAIRTCMGVDRSEGLAGRLAAAWAVAARAGRALIKKESEGMVRALDSEVTIHKKFFRATNRHVFISDDSPFRSPASRGCTSSPDQAGRPFSPDTAYQLQNNQAPPLGPSSGGRPYEVVR